MTIEREDCVFVLDGDTRDADAVLAAFLKRMNETGADIVVGTYPVRSLRNRLYYALVRAFLGIDLKGTQSGARLFRRGIYEYARDRALAKSGAYELELLTIAVGHGARIVEADYRPDGYSGASSKLIAKDTLAVFYRARILGYYEKCLVPKKLDREPLVSIVIACPNRSWMLEECLDAIAKQTYRNFEVIVLPDGEVKAEGEGERRNVRFLPTGKVRPAEKRNLGIREAKGEIIAFIDDDAYPDRSWLEHAVRYFSEDSIGAVGGPGVTPPGDCGLARIGGRVYDNLLVSGSYRYRYRAGGVRMDVEDYPSCNLFVRRDLLQKIGGYRTDFWPGEDTLLCKDIVDSWKRIIYDPWIVVYHHRRPLLMPHLRQLGRYAFHRGYFCKRYPSNSLRPAYFVPTFFTVYLVLFTVMAVIPEPSVMSIWTFSLWHAFIAVPMLVYLAAVFATTFAFNPVVWALTAVGVVASHIVYGVRFAQGLLASRAPCEYIGKDHGVSKNG